MILYDNCCEDHLGPKQFSGSFLELVNNWLYITTLVFYKLIQRSKRHEARRGRPNRYDWTKTLKAAMVKARRA